MADPTLLTQKAVPRRKGVQGRGPHPQPQPVRGGAPHTRPQSPTQDRSSPRCGHSYLPSLLGQGILQVSDPAASYLDGLAQEGRAPRGVGEECLHGGRLCPSPLL